MEFWIPKGVRTAIPVGPFLHPESVSSHTARDLICSQPGTRPPSSLSSHFCTSFFRRTWVCRVEPTVLASHCAGQGACPQTRDDGPGRKPRTSLWLVKCWPIICDSGYSRELSPTHLFTTEAPLPPMISLSNPASGQVVLICPSGLPNSVFLSVYCHTGLPLHPHCVSHPDPLIPAPLQQSLLSAHCLSLPVSRRPKRSSPSCPLFWCLC